MGKKSVAQENWDDFSYHKEDRWSKKRKYKHDHDDIDEFERKKTRQHKQSRHTFDDDE